ncbi:hypothetical protein GcM1_241077 [Golovinomyces cichoracearum]|uniref:CCHC-type domain-containing protein n=1 Tax=Golovinomyces cichoracearum TaxID=62708 RepID=A0A420IHR6_9PEZI|nr:hypothetical protein GcM1_241077 [Golovinomyces cichoracearum]
MEGGISRACWFNDLCNKITPGLRHDIRGEKFRMSEDYTRLDEFLQYLDRENAAIILDTRARPNSQPSANHGENYFQVLTKATSPEKDALQIFKNNTAPTSKILPRGSILMCYECKKPGHYKSDFPRLLSVNGINNFDAKDVEEDELSENC